MTRRAPVFATWLLERFGVKQQNEALIGDLAEEYQAGKSAAWYWWQTLAAIAVAVPRDVREHKLLAVRAVATGWILMFALTWMLRFTFPHWRPTSQSLVVSLAFVYTTYLFWGLVGWLVARTHRAQAAAMVLSYFASQILVTAWRLSDHLIMRPGQPPHLSVAFFAQMLVAMLCTIAGGLLVRPKAQPEPPSTMALARS